MHYLERKSQVPRVGDQLALRLREEMDAAGLTAKQVSRLVSDRTPYSLDYRAVQNAMAGTASINTAGILAAVFGWSFIDDIMAPVIGATRLAALERAYDQKRSEMAAMDREIRALRMGSLAVATVDRGGLRLVPPEDRSWPPQGWSRAGDVGASEAGEGSR